MKVFVGGATGRELLLRPGERDRGREAEAHLPEGEGLRLRLPHLVPVLGDELLDLSLEGCDAVFFVAGSRGKDLLQTDAFGAVKLMKAADAQSINRFIMLSSMFTLEPEKWAQEPGIADITDYNIAKMFADHWLTQTDLDWTIVQAGLLREEDPTGKIVINPDHEGPVAIPDIASTLAAALPMPTTYRQVIRVKNGETPIADALAAV